MKVFEIYLKHTPKTVDIKHVRLSLRFLHLLFPLSLIFLFFRGFILLGLLTMGFALLLALTGISVLLVSIIPSLFLVIFASDLESFFLKRRGYKHIKTIPAKTHDEAIIKAFSQ